MRTESPTAATVADALSSMFPSAEVATPEKRVRVMSRPRTQALQRPTSQPTTNSADELVAQALNLFEEADAALKRGGVDGLTEYQTKTAAATELFRKAAERLGTSVLPLLHRPVLALRFGRRRRSQ